MALSKEQAKAFYDKAVEAGYSDDEIVAELKSRNASSAPERSNSQLLRTESSDSTPEFLAKAAVNAVQTSPMGQYATGALNQFRGMGRGARQLFNKLAGDEEELARLNAEEPALRARDEELTSTDPFLAGAGTGMAMLAPAALPVPGGGSSMAMRMLAGGAGGALGGGAQPLTPEEEAGGNREAGALLGGSLGAAAPLVLSGGGALARMLRRQDPDEALQAFAKSRLGAERGGENLPAYQAVGREVQETEDALRDALSKRYGAIEGNPDLPPVSLSGTMDTTGNIPANLTDEVAMAFSPRARKVIQAANRGATHTSPLVDTGGSNFVRPETTTFSDVRETIRELRRVRRIMARNESTAGQSAQLGRVEEALQNDLQNWASTDPSLAQTLRQAGEVDADYAKQIVPFQSQQTNLGRYGKTNQYDEQTLDRMFMNNQSGQALQDLIERVPGAKDPLRQIYGNKLLQSRGTIGNIRQLEGGTAGEALLSKKERDYLVEIADKLRQGDPQDLHLGMISRAMRLPGIRKAVNAAVGVGPYQDVPEGVLNTQFLVDALRGIAAGQSAKVLEE